MRDRDQHAGPSTTRPSPESDDRRSALRQDLAGLSYGEQCAAVQPPLPLGSAGYGSAVQRQEEGGTGQGGLHSTRFGGHPTFEAVGRGERYLRYGCAEADVVTALQETCGEAGFDPGPSDGLWGPKTNAAIVRYQASSGLGADGIVGPLTMKALDEIASAGGGGGGGGGDGPAPDGPVPDGTDDIDMSLIDELLAYLNQPEPDESARGFIGNALGNASPFVLASFSENEEEVAADAEKVGKANRKATEAVTRITARFGVLQRPYPKGVYADKPASLREAGRRMRMGLHTDEREWLYDWSMVVGLLTLVFALPRDSQQNLVIDPARLRIATIALGEVGKVEAHTNSGSGNRCKGADRLEYYYTSTGTAWSAGVGDWRLNIDSTKSQAPYTGHKRVSWCQIFAGWARREAATSGNWVTEGENYQPQVGDTVYLQNDNQHEGVIIAVYGGNKVSTVDANVGPMSGIVVSERTIGAGSGITFRRTIL